MWKTSHGVMAAVLLLGLVLGYAVRSLDPSVLHSSSAAQPETPPPQAALAQAKNAKPAAAAKPNIVFMMTDNLGYGEVGCYGGGILRGAATPRIDQLASEGLRLLNFNVEAQCTPSRSALLTGRFSIRSGTLPVNRGGGPYGLAHGEH